MAVVTTKSDPIGDRDTVPRVDAIPAHKSKGKVRRAIGMVESVSGDDIASKYIMLELPSNACVKNVFLSCDDIGSTTIADIGVYQTTAKGGAVVDADFFGSAVSLKDGALTRSNVTHESGAYNIDDLEKPLWEALGLTEDSDRTYDLVLTLTAASDAAGTIILEVEYVID